MATYTWPVKAGGRVFPTKAKKADAERLMTALRRMVDIRSSFRELSGVIDEDEHACVLMQLFTSGGHEPTDPEGYEQEKLALFAKMDGMGEIVAKDIPGLIAEAGDITHRHLAIVDKRQTREERNAADAKSAATYATIQAKESAKHDAFYAKYGQAGVEKSWGDGEMAVYLKLTYNDSDSMRDYYHPHATYGQALLLGVVKKGAQTQAIARSMVAKYPDLAGVEFEWHVENYSMGHGNYLQSTEIVDHAEGVTTYAGYKDPGLTYEVSFQSWAGKMTVYKDYPGKTVTASETSEPITSSNPLLIVSEGVHTQKNVPIWLVKIAQRVDRAVYDQLASQARRYGGQWSRFSSAFLFYDAGKAQTFVQNAQV